MNCIMDMDNGKAKTHYTTGSIVTESNRPRMIQGNIVKEGEEILFEDGPNWKNLTVEKES